MPEVLGAQMGKYLAPLGPKMPPLYTNILMLIIQLTAQGMYIG